MSIVATTDLGMDLVTVARVPLPACWHCMYIKNIHKCDYASLVVIACLTRVSFALHQK